MYLIDFLFVILNRLNKFIVIDLNCRSGLFHSSLCKSEASIFNFKISFLCAYVHLCGKKNLQFNLYKTFIII